MLSKFKAYLRKEEAGAERGRGLELVHSHHHIYIYLYLYISGYISDRSVYTLISEAWKEFGLYLRK